MGEVKFVWHCMAWHYEQKYGPYRHYINIIAVDMEEALYKLRTVYDKKEYVLEEIKKGGSVEIL